ncbi:MAG TPA: shikimate dehydrogenase [Methanomassiliicoccales archaeon]|nr:shikimate dehydrogenase [Methanomassiliicoccales archaeon]
MTRICVAISEADAASAIAVAREAIARGAECLEFRFDHMPMLPDDLTPFQQLEVRRIATLREREQGGEWEGTNEKKWEFLWRAARAGFDIDLELGHPLVNRAHLLKPAKVIVSYHDNKKTPQVARIIESLVECSARSDMAKAAYSVRTMHDLAQLVEATDWFSLSRERYTVIGMGEMGMVTRVLAHRMGSVLSYASVSPGKETAPGQLDLETSKWLGKEPVVTGIIGNPLDHTLSPLMHNAAFRAAAVRGVYLKWVTMVDELEDFLDVVEVLGIKGFNVTIPHKETIVPLLDRVDPVAERLGAVNTVVNEGGSLVGRNTDVIGVERTFEGHGVDVKGRTALVLGAGGASRSVLSFLMSKGADADITNRTMGKAESLAKTFGAEAVTARVAEEKAYDIIVNCTPLGMKGFPQEMSISPHVLREGQFVMDTVYNPPVTPLLAEAARKNAIAVNGKDMLIYQALASFEMWTGKAVDYEVMDKAFREALP